MANGQPPAGWYPDPAGDASVVRYWDGNTWTEQTQPMVNQQSLNNIGTPPPTPQPVYTPGQTVQTYMVAPAEKDHKGFAVAGLAIGIASIVFFCLSWVDAIIGIVGVVLSAIGIKSSRKKMAITGLVLSIIGIVVSIIFLFLLFDMMSDPTKYGLPSNYFDTFM